jgi:hypothetical protein
MERLTMIEAVKEYSELILIPSHLMTKLPKKLLKRKTCMLKAIGTGE